MIQLFFALTVNKYFLHIYIGIWSNDCIRPEHVLHPWHSPMKDLWNIKKNMLTLHNRIHVRMVW